MTIFYDTDSRRTYRSAGYRAVMPGEQYLAKTGKIKFALTTKNYNLVLREIDVLTHKDLPGQERDYSK